MSWRDRATRVENKTADGGWRSRARLVSTTETTESLPPEQAEVEAAPQKEGWIKRAARAVRETVSAPIAPWLALSKNPQEQDLGRRAISPQLGQVGLAQVAQEIGDKGRAGGFAASKRVGEMIAESPLAKTRPTAAAALGTAAGTVGDIAAGGAILSPQDAQVAAGMEAGGIVGQMGAQTLKREAISAARKALGFTKQHLHSTKSWTESLRKQAQANQAAEMMLNKNAISPIGNPENMAKRAMGVLRDSERAMDGVLSSLDNAGTRLKIDDIASDLIDKLKPRFADEQNVAEAIITDLQQFPEGLTLTEAKTILKKRWGNLGYDKTFGTTATSMYRKAAEVLENSIKKTIQGSGGRELADAYAVANKTWGNATNALKGLGNKAAQEMGNNLLDIPTHIMAAGQLASGDVRGALTWSGLLQAARRRGMAPVAVGINAVSKGARPGARSIAATGARFVNNSRRK